MCFRFTKIKYNLQIKYISISRFISVTAIINNSFKDINKANNHFQLESLLITLFFPQEIQLSGDTNNELLFFKNLSSNLNQVFQILNWRIVILDIASLEFFQLESS